ncbi:hypothetical protein C8R46DRAFT_1225944 [Mycena filopes]|nr:hypothetical protein C8R46DRAFT_1225944 [Mycena filopes]
MLQRMVLCTFAYLRSLVGKRVKESWDVATELDSPSIPHMSPKANSVLVNSRSLSLSPYLGKATTKSTQAQGLDFSVAQYIKL